ncbi:MAG: alkaline phosphatase family protein [Candidatus Xenobia bacterium]
MDDIITHDPLNNRLADDRTPADLKGKAVTDWSAMTFYPVNGIVKPKTEDDIKQALAYAKQHGLTVSVAGARHSQGGQAMRANALFLDMTEFSGASYHPDTKSVTVRSGTAWLDLQKYLDNVGRSVEVKQASSPFTVGGSISVNCHGEDPRFGTIGSTVKSMRVMLADGSIVRCSRDENADLFRHVIGGYGLFGVLLDADLETTHNEMYTQKYQTVKTTQIPDVINKEIAANPNKRLFVSELSMAPSSLLDQATLWSCEVTGERTKCPEMQDADASKLHVLMGKLPYQFAIHSTLGKHLLWWAEKALQPLLGSKFVSRNNAMAMDYELCRIPVKGHSQVIQEYFIPKDHYLDFVNKLKPLIKKYDTNVIYASTRYIKADQDSALPYAKGDCFSVVLFRDQKTTAEEQAKMDLFSRDAADQALKLGGSFYLCYQLPYSKEQVKQAYPGIDQFFDAKRQYDPNGLFINSLWDKYATLVPTPAPAPAPAPDKPAFKNIDHVVVLMMENRSFDNMLGFLKDKNPEIEGLTGQESVPVDPADPSKGTVPVHRGGRMLGDANPGHEFENVNVQLFGTDKPTRGAAADMKGFYKDYLAAQPKEMDPARKPQEARHIMDGFLPEQLPVLSELAQKGVVCDHWFAALPSSTFPNRVFLMCAKSDGMVNSAGSMNDPEFKGALLGKLYGDNPTIYDELTAAHKTWKNYYSDIPWSFIVPHVRDHADHVVKLKNFFKDVERGTLPNYSLIEPAYLNTLTHKATDQDQPHDVRDGERLIADVYNALRKSPDWDKTLLVVVYDEHGGTYDHVTPPACPAPDGVKSKDADFNFEREGVRVPAILIGGRVPSGVVDHTVYDHTSIPKFVEKLYDLKPLSQRDANIATFDHQIKDAINYDTPFHIEPPPPSPEKCSDPRLYGPGEPTGVMSNVAVAGFQTYVEVTKIANKLKHWFRG